MTKFFRNSLILIAPFFLMVLVNEIIRLTIQKNNTSYLKVKTINTALPITSKCTWHCHHNTQYCKDNHVKWIESYFKYTDSVYFGIIRALKSTGDYGMANVVFWVVFLPLLMFFFFIKSLDLQTEIKKHNRK